MSAKMSSATAEKYPNLTSVVSKTTDLNDIRDFLSQMRPIDAQRSEANRVNSSTENLWKLLKQNIARRLNLALDTSKEFRDPVTGYVVTVKRTTKQGTLNSDALLMGAQRELALFGIDDALVEEAFREVNIKLAYKYVCNNLGLTDEQFEAIWDNAYTPSTDEYYDVRLYDTGVFDRATLAEQPSLEEKLEQSLSLVESKLANVNTKLHLVKDAIDMVSAPMPTPMYQTMLPPQSEPVQTMTPEPTRPVVPARPPVRRKTGV